MNLNIKEAMKKKLPEHKDERGKRERIAMKALAGFLVIMMVLTVLSRLADSITIPKVSVTNPKGGRVEHTLECTGSLEAKNEIDVEAKEGFNIKEIFVEDGDQVSKGDPLLKLDMEELQERIQSTSVDIEKMKLQKKQMALGGGGSSSGDLVADAKLAVERLEEDKKLTTEQEDVKIKRAEEELAEAEKELLEAEEALSEEEKKNEETKDKEIEKQITKAKEEVEEAKKNLENQKYEQEKALKRAKQAIDEAEKQLWLTDGDVTMILEQIKRAEMEYEMTKNDWKRNVQDAEEALKKVEDKLTKLEAGESDEEGREADKSKVELAKESVKNKQRAVEDAKYNKEQTLAKFDREILDANRKIVEAEKETVKNNETQAKEEAKNDVSQELLQLDIDLKEEELSKLLEIKASNNTITAPVSGTIDKVNVKKGEKTPGTALMTMISEDTRYVFEAEVDKYETEKLEVGDKVAITLEGEKTPVEEETVIERIETLTGDKEGKKKIIVNLTEGTPGLSGKLIVRKESEKYPNIIPAEALREDRQGKYVLVVRQQVTTLGEQQIAERTSVTELDKNGKMVGVQGGLNSGDQVITESNKPIEAGDRVRLVSQ